MSPGWEREVGVPVTVRVSRRARRIALRVMAGERGVELILPRGVPRQIGLGFLASKRGWIAARLDDLPLPVPFAEGAVIPVLGAPHRIRRDDGPRAPKVAIAAGEIRVRPAPRDQGSRGDPKAEAADLARHVRDHLVALARAEATRRAQVLAARLGRPVAQVGVRDTRSRWGSCSAAGNLSFSWRLVLAPESVFDYVVAHEVAHLVEMNHGPRFWELVDRLHPGRAAARAWLRKHRAELLSYGATPAAE